VSLWQRDTAGDTVPRADFSIMTLFAAAALAAGPVTVLVNGREIESSVASEERESVLAETEYGVRFAVAVGRGKVFGGLPRVFQFFIIFLSFQKPFRMEVPACRKKP
jgi:hypothetical protein